MLIPCPVGEAYDPYQIEAIKFAMPREAVLFGDEMGLGKTIQAIGWANTMPWIERMLVVCPDTGKINWRRELDKWLISPCVETTIINYESLHKLDYEPIYDLALLDEGHYIKNELALRTTYCMRIKARRRGLLTGTPLLSRPIELWSPLRWLYPDKFPESNRHSYSVRYCGGRVAEKDIVRRNGSIIKKKYWYEEGATCLGELYTNLRQHIMIRRLKETVMQDLPEKRRQIVELPTEGLSAELREEIRKANLVFDRIESTYSQDIQKMEDELRVSWGEMAKLRHEVGLAKAEMAVPLIEDAVDSCGKVVVFAHHRDVIEHLMKETAHLNPVHLWGGMSPKIKQTAIDKFQHDVNTKIFIGQLQAAGTVITLTAASHEIFVEEDWTPGIMDQAEDRCHRRGQKNAVLAQHLALEGSLDARMFKTQERKRKTISRALDGAGKEKDYGFFRVV